MKHIIRMTGPALALLALAACSGSAQRASGSATRMPDAASRLHVAGVAEAAGQMDVAMAMYSATAQAEPDNAQAQATYADANMRAGNLAGAHAILAAALARHADDIALLRTAGRLSLVEGRASEALSIFRRRSVAKPNDSQALDGQGLAQDMLGAHQEAQRAYSLALAADPDNVAASNNLAMSLLLSGHAAEAAARLDELRRRPDAPQRVQINFALAEGVAGKCDAAQALLGGQSSSAQIDSVLTELRLPAGSP